MCFIAVKNKALATVIKAEGHDSVKAVNLEAEVALHPLVQAVLAAFPGARITDIRTAETEAAGIAAAAIAALPEVEDEWNPFEAE